MASLHLLELLDPAAVHVIASLALLKTVCARTDSTDLGTRSCRRNTAPRDRENHAYITLRTLLTVTTYLMLS